MTSEVVDVDARGSRLFSVFDRGTSLTTIERSSVFGGVSVCQCVSVFVVFDGVVCVCVCVCLQSVLSTLVERRRLFAMVVCSLPMAVF